MIVQRTKINCQGQSVIESVAATLLMAGMVFFIFCFVHLRYLKITGDYILYEYLVCQETKSLQNSCVNELTSIFKNLMVFSKAEKIEMKKTKSSSSISVLIKVDYAKIRFHLKESVKLPLQLQ
jgi:hypothetical protein